MKKKLNCIYKRIAFRASDKTNRLNNTKLIGEAQEFVPHGIPVQCLFHFAQIYNNGGKKYFKKYDFGAENMKIYGSLEPPSYDFSLVKTKIRLFYGNQDKYLNEELMQMLTDGLCNADLSYQIMRDYGHATFFFGTGAEEFYTEMLSGD